MKKNIIKIIFLFAILLPSNAFCATGDTNTASGTTVVVNTYEQVFDQQTIFDLASVEMVGLIIGALLGGIFYFKKPAF